MGCGVVERRLEKVQPTEKRIQRRVSSIILYLNLNAAKWKWLVIEKRGQCIYLLRLMFEHSEIIITGRT